MKKTLMVLVVSLALVALASMASASDHWEDDREMTYVGSWSPVYYTCDDSDGHLGTGFHAIGGGVFCGVLTGGSVTVSVNDAVLDEPLAQVGCAWEREETPVPPEPLPTLITLIVTSTEILAEANPTATFDVPEECLESTSGDAPDGSTDIGIFPEAHELAGGEAVFCCSYTTGTITLVYN